MRASLMSYAARGFCSYVLAGKGDSFETVQELVASVRQGVLLDTCMVPAVGMVNRKGRPLVLNRYILDYWQHGSRRAIAKGNHISEGDF